MRPFLARQSSSRFFNVAGSTTMTKDSFISHGRLAFFAQPQRFYLPLLVGLHGYFHCASPKERREPERSVSVYFGNELPMNYQVLVFQLCFHFSFVLVAVINGPAKRLLLQFGAKKKKPRGRDARMLSCLIISLCHFPYFKLRIIMSFRKLIPPFTLAVYKLDAHSNSQARVV